MNITQTIEQTDGTLAAAMALSQKRRNEMFAQTGKRVTFQQRMSERQVTILNRLGLHARPAAEFVRAVRTFQSSVTLIKNGDNYSGASILEVLSANLDHGCTLVIRVEGPDADSALEHLCWLLHEFKRQEDEDTR